MTKVIKYIHGDSELTGNRVKRNIIITHDKTENRERTDTDSYSQHKWNSERFPERSLSRGLEVIGDSDGYHGSTVSDFSGSMEEV